jgi:hypothetical protein
MMTSTNEHVHTCTDPRKLRFLACCFIYFHFSGGCLIIYVLAFGQLFIVTLCDQSNKIKAHAVHVLWRFYLKIVC